MDFDGVVRSVFGGSSMLVVFKNVDGFLHIVFLEVFQWILIGLFLFQCFFSCLRCFERFFCADFQWFFGLSRRKCFSLHRIAAP